MRTLATWLVSLAVMSFSACSDSGSGPPLPDYIPDAEMFAKDVAEEDFIEVAQAATGAFRAPANLIILALTEDASLDEASRLAGIVDGAVVGQFPRLRMFQIEIDSSTLTELDTAIDALRADPVVEWVGYDLEIETLQDICPVDHDNRRLPQEHRCVYEDIESDEALTVFEHFRSQLNLEPVRVGVVDSGINISNPELEDTLIIDAHGEGGAWTDNLDDPGGHGTKITALITADNDGSGIDGLASVYLKDKLSIVFGKKRGQVFPTLISTGHVLNAGAQVVNFSLGFNKEIGNNETLRAGYYGFRALIRSAPDVLFVCSMPNHPFVVTETNHAPAGIPELNVLNVAGSQACEPTTPYANSGRGHVIHIAAPAQDVTTIHAETGTPLERNSGNSAAAPQVTSLAAILLSMNPDLSPDAIRDDYIQRMYNIGPEDVGGKLLNFPMTIARLMLDSGLNGGIIDGEPNDKVDSTVQMVCRICGCPSWFRVDSVADFESEKSEEVVGSMGGNVFNLNMVNSSMAMTLACNNCLFDLREFPLAAPGMLPADVGQAQFTQVTGRTAMGNSMGGVWNIQRCRISQRINELAHMITVEGGFEGPMEVNFLEDNETIATEFSGAFNAVFVAGDLAEDDPLIKILEKKCENGKDPPNSPAEELLVQPSLTYVANESRSGADARVHFLVTGLPEDQAMAWADEEVAPTAGAEALHIVLFASDWNKVVGQPVSLPVAAQASCADTQPAWAEAGGVAVTQFAWSEGQASPVLCAISGEVTLEKLSADLLEVTLDVEFEGGTRTLGWQIRFDEWE